VPIKSSEIDFENRLRMLIIGLHKTGKTAAVVSTSPGPVRHILCEDFDAVRHANRISPDGHFDVEPVNSWETMQAAINVAKADADAGRIKTVVIDPVHEFAEALLEQCYGWTETKEKKENGLAAYGEFRRKFSHFVEQIKRIPCNVIVISNYAWTGPDRSDSVDKTGDGIVPLIPGSSRTTFAGKINDVVWFDIDQDKCWRCNTKPDNCKCPASNKGTRIFVTKPGGVWQPGIGGRSLPVGVVMSADVSAFIKLVASENRSEPQRPVVKPPGLPQRKQQPRK
jgi:hypothetical protein